MTAYNLLKKTVGGMCVAASLLSALCGMSVQAAPRRLVAYVTSWTDVVPEPRFITNINYAFGGVAPTFDRVEIANPRRLRTIVALKERDPRLEVQLSVGGWGSGRFSEMAADSALRKAFAADCRRIVDEYGLDGIDIDWEYPTSAAAGISASPDDTSNFTLLMRDLRQALPEGALLTLATVYNAAFIDFPAIMPYVDFVNIMAYDMASPPRHHSPLHASEVCGANSAESAVDAHIKAGVPPEKLTLGLPFYGRGRAPYPDFVNFGEMRLEPGCQERWDSVACAPYIVGPDGSLALGFENARSLAAKCDFIKRRGLLGAMYWEYAADDAASTLRSEVARHMIWDSYPADYARRPRFNALIYYSDTAEEAHVAFARQALEFFHRLSYGEGYTYTVATSLAAYADSLEAFDVIIAINAMPAGEKERRAFERYMEAGGGWVGFHAAAYNDGRTAWPWFNRFLGAGTFYCNNWPPQPALLDVEGGASHAVTANLPERFVAPACEWYQWTPSPRESADVDVLLSLSPRNYPIGIKDIVSFGDFPVVWANRRYRMIYLNMGHGDEEFTDATQNLLFVNSLRWIVNRRKAHHPEKR